MSERGVLVACDIEFNSRANLMHRGGHLPEFEQHLRRWVLLWDQIGIARNLNTIVSGYRDLNFLAECDFVKYFDVQHPGGEVAQTFHDVNLMAFTWLEKHYPGTWAVDVSPGSLHSPGHNFFPSGHTLERRGAIVTLTNAVPVPDKEVPLEDLLRFKEHRKAELLAMRQQIDELYQRIGKSEDPAHALTSGLDQLTTSVNEAIRTMRERRLPFRMSTELASINIAGALLAAVPEVIAEQPLPTVLANAAAAAVSLGVGFEWIRRKGTGSPFQYVAHYHRDVFHD